MPNYPKSIVELIHQLGLKKPGGLEIGPVQQEFFEHLQTKNPTFTNPEYIITGDGVRHLQKSRMEKPKPKDRMTPEEVGEIVNSLTSSTRIHGVTGKIDHPDAGVVPHGERTHLGIFRPKDGKVAIHTAYDPETKKLPKKLGSPANTKSSYKDWVDANLPSNYAPGEAGREFTQHQLSAVESLQKQNKPDGENVKSLLPWAIPGGLLGALAPADAQATPYFPIPESRPADGLFVAPSDNAAGYRVIDDKPLGSPWFDPADFLTAPIGVATAGGKALAAAASPFASAATNWATETAGNAFGGLLGKLGEIEQSGRFGGPKEDVWPLR